MKKKYFDIISSLKQSTSPMTLNDRVMIVDGTNQFIRAFAAAPITSEHGYHVGGTTGFLMSLGYAIRNINPTRIIIIFDGKGGSQRRRKLYPEYKAGRKTHTNIINTEFYSTKQEETESMVEQLIRLTDYLDVLPVQTVCIDNIEADDTIAYLTRYFQEKYNSHITIMSTDGDFLQLVNENVVVWSPTKKKFYSIESIADEFEGLPSKNHIFYKILIGDGSDNIPGVKGLGLKTIKKRLPILFENNTEICLDDIFNYVTAKKDENKIYGVLADNKQLLELNYNLMQLSNVDLPATTKEKILNTIDLPINRLVKHKFISMLVHDAINSAFKTPDVWLQTHFSKVDGFAIESYPTRP